MSYKGKAFFSTLPHGRSECVLVIRGSQLVAQLPDGGELGLDLTKVNFKRRGSKNQELVFSSEHSEGPVFSTMEPKIFEDICTLGLPEFDQSVKNYRSEVRSKRMRKYVIPIGTLVLLAIFIPWFIFGPMVEIVVAMMPITVDQQLGDIALGPEEMILFGTPVTDQEVTSKVQDIADRLILRVENKDFRFQVIVCDNKTVNAFAAPNGKIVVMTGLLEKCRTPEELAGILSHEISHVTQRHAVKTVVKTLILYAALAFIIGDVSGLSDMIIAYGGQLTNLSFSRDMEREADKNGFLLMKRAEIDPVGLRDFFEQLQKIEQRPGDEFLLRFMSTHPVTSERLETLDALVLEHGKGNPKKIEMDWQTLHEKLKK